MRDLPHACAVLWCLAWIAVQPWFLWPSLDAESSHRLTLAVCGLGLGLSTVGQSGVKRAVPFAWWGWGVGMLLIMAWQHRHIVSEGAYLDAFRETALLSDGAWIVVALLFGVWALRQAPDAWWRALRWIGVCWCAANVLALACQVAGARIPGIAFHPSALPAAPPFPRDHLTGLLGLDRCLGASGVAWLPILWSWSPWLAILPLLMVSAAGKTTAWLGVLLVAWRLRCVPRWAIGLSLIAVLCIGGITTGPPIHNKLVQRVATWWPALCSLREHPFIGNGFSPLAVPRMQERYGAILPSLHSDWLALAFHTGLVMTVWAGWLCVRVFRSVPRTPLAHALQTSLLALVVMSTVQPVLSHARILSVFLLMLVWWWHEQVEKEFA